ncbi:MAG: hypothetical protein ISR55_08680 [Bacteroidetes bacterium]|nr:hypothetical protein [Bacteroidota bacterium]
MNRLWMMLLICPLTLCGQDYKNIKGYKYLNQLTASLGYDLNPGQIEKNGNYYLFAFQDTGANGMIHRYRVRKNGKIKLNREIGVDQFQNRNFAGQLSVSGDNQTMVFTSSYLDAWGNNELCISGYDARSNKYSDIRLLGEINDNEQAEAYPWISSDALRIYYTLNNKVYYSSRPNGSVAFKFPQELKVDYPWDDFDCISCWLANDELTIYLTGEQSVYKSVRSNIREEFGAPVLLLSGFENFISGFCISEKNKLAFIFYSGLIEDDDEFVEEKEMILIYKIKK